MVVKQLSKIFYIEDDTNIRELVEYTLKSSGFSVQGFEFAESFFKKTKTEKPDLILLDIMLPDMDGISILKEIRNNSDLKDIPVIMLTAKSGQLDKIKGLDEGADDYITKPFDIIELISRIKAVLRRTKPNEENICHREIILNKKRHNLTVNGIEISLTYKEFELLYHLLLNRGIVLGRDKLMNLVWGTDFEGETRTVDVHIRTLRQKLGACGEYIKTVRNVGYKIDNE